MCLPDEITERKADCDMGLVNPSARLCAEATNPMSEIAPLRYPSRAAAMSNMRRFSLVLEPFDMESKRLLLSVNSRSGSWRLVRVDNSVVMVYAASNISLNDMSSEAMADLQIRRALYDRKMRGMTLSVLSPRNTRKPS